MSNISKSKHRRVEKYGLRPFNVFIRLARRKRKTIIKYIFETLFPSSTFGKLGQIFAALSLFALLQKAAQIGLSSTFVTILSVYVRSIELTIGNLDPLVKSIISVIKEYIRIDFHFSEGWRYIFVVLQMLFIRDAGTALSDGRIFLSVVRFIAGICISFLCSILIYAPNVENQIISNLVFCIIPVFGIFIYDIVMYLFSATLFFDQIGVGESENNTSRRIFFYTGCKWSLIRFFIVAIPSAAMFLLPQMRLYAFPEGGIIAIFIGLIANTIYWLFQGVAYAYSQKKIGRKFRKAFIASESGRFGLAIAGVLFWLFVFCIVNAGGRIIEL